MRLAFWIYQALGWLAVVVGWPFVLVKGLRDPRYRVGWRERLGIWPRGAAAPGAARPIWLHCASLGETQAAAPLVGALKNRGARLLLTTTSPSGREAARTLAGDAGHGRLLPLDLAPLVAGAFRTARPQALVVVETELWPALLWEARKAGVPCVLVNGRISDRTFPRYQRIRRWVGPLLQGFASIHARSALDAERFRMLGAPAALVCVGGDLKYDLPPPDPGRREAAALRRARAGGWRVLLGGSTHPGEEEALLSAAEILEARGLRVGLVLAPRHLERVAEVEALVLSRGRVSRLWGELHDPLEEGILAAFAARDVILVDRYGLLATLYGGAEAAFVGGTLAPVGGHNLLEPLNWGVPVLFGPHTENAREVAADVLRLRLGEEVSGAEALAEGVERYLVEPERLAGVRAEAARLFDENRGAVTRAVAVLEHLGALERAGEET